MSRRPGAGLAMLLLSSAAFAQADGAPVYRCPGNPESYTNMLTAQQAKEKGCRTIDGAPITIVQTRRPAPAAPATASRPSDSRVDPSEQRARDNDARRILQDELQREEQRLAELRKEFNEGQPERRGDERNYQKYLDRVAGLKAQIERKADDVAAIRRELAKVAP
ncbi:hypothetical protein CKO44_04695 [Rubrivivax gelatinosus]|uniref:DUF4124 domain-containing protein n=1 Tax=Rubrivivax gelatinosus TaxID=28068 RepID=A0ABS1DQM7_RUBGE|nr:hypothetical protein [Rubrivivax gelatinosus]MBK1612766.1 hypothetical protein [Rubrivivax gelatinosus]MBK1711500.1 hypothetical protein [Rubrivivax gelatinosus]